MLAVWLARYWPQLAVAVLVLAVGFASYRWAYDRGEAAERARWEQANREAAERFAEALAAQQAVLEATDAEVARLRKAANKRREAVSDAVQNDPASRDWAGVAIPHRMRRALGDLAVPADPEVPDDALRP